MSFVPAHRTSDRPSQRHTHAITMDGNALSRARLPAHSDWPDIDHIGLDWRHRDDQITAAEAPTVVHDYPLPRSGLGPETLGDLETVGRETVESDPDGLAGSGSLARR